MRDDSCTSTIRLSAAIVCCYCCPLRLKTKNLTLSNSLAQATRYWRLSHTHTAHSCKPRLCCCSVTHTAHDATRMTKCGVGPAKKQGLNTAFEHAWSADHGHAAMRANTSFRDDSTAIGARVSAQGELTCTNGQIK